jgi:hypothetical protein
LSLSFTKKLTLLCKCLFICLKLLFVFIATIACCLYLTCFFVLLTIAISSMLYYYTMFFFFPPVCIKHHLCTWLGISFVWFQKCLQCITLDTFYILLICLYMWIYGMQIKYQYQYQYQYTPFAVSHFYAANIFCF